VDPRAGACTPFRVPLTLPEPDVVADEGIQRLAVTLEGGQTVALTIALGDGNKGEAPTYIIHLAYRDEDHGQPDDRSPR
jgi:hypothetical protein